MDVISTSFPGDVTAGTFKRRLDADYFQSYAEKYLWKDGGEPLAVKPQFCATEGPMPAAGYTVEREMERPEFEDYLARYWQESTFRYFRGTPAILDLVCRLGRDRSDEEGKHVDDFREIASLAVRLEKETLLRFGDIRPVSIQFFHVFDEEDGTRMNFHIHNLLLLT